MLRKILVLTVWFALAEAYPIIHQEFITDLDLITDLELINELDLINALELTAELECTADLELATTESTATPESTTTPESPADLESTADLISFSDVELTMDVHFEDTQAFKLSTEVKSNTHSFEEASTKAMEDVAAAQSEKPMTRRRAEHLCGKQPVHLSTFLK
uniref:uncharacterized protein LOC118522720 isoform X2 n=1 Tax=Halichoerus grypus TaxID=9711 RepID=UPI001658D923|nr:uncharacterized protein LOC118522720 isoform X2 [Halichoerus grypus]